MHDRTPELLHKIDVSIKELQSLERDLSKNGGVSGLVEEVHRLIERINPLFVELQFEAEEDNGVRELVDVMVTLTIRVLQLCPSPPDVAWMRPTVSPQLVGIWGS